MSCKPAGYYGLKLSESIEEAIQVLDYKDLVTLAHSLTYHIGDGTGERFYCFIPLTPSSFDDAIDSLSLKAKISLIRWVSELIEAKCNGQS